jgi:peptidoglycan-associated lipoprotein
MRIVVIAGVLLSLVGCTGQFVKRDEFDATVGQLRASDARLADDLEGFRGQFTEMTRDLSKRFNQYDATIGNLQGRLRVEMSAHFDFDDATLREADKPGLTEFSEVVSQYEPNVIVTVEGFTDSQGNPAYNEQLGLRRAKAVRDFLVNVGGLHPDRVRAVSYGEDERRRLPTGTGTDHSANRRVSLVVDYVGLAPAQ